MFLICRIKDTCVRSLSKLISKLEGITCGPVQLFQLYDHWMGWSRCKAHENLHVFDDGILIGKLSFSETGNDMAILHKGLMPAQIHPLATGVKIAKKGNSTVIEPLNITNIFYGGTSVSDMQLLIADAEGFLPSPEGVGILATVGFFPGNMSLFAEIRKIPFQVRYELNRYQLTDIPSFTVHKPDNDRLLERFKEIVPEHPCQYLGMSAGYDSRFVLGVLRQREVVPHLIHVAGSDTEFVERIAEQLGLPYTKVAISDSAYLPPEIYTLITDAQIYFRGGNYSCVRDSLKKHSLYYTGHMPEPVIRYYRLRMVKQPGFTGRVYEKLIETLLIRSNEKMTNGLLQFNSLRDIRKYLLNELKFVNEYCSFRTRKEWANWFYYLNKGIRWSSATMADLSYFTQPVFLLADLEALTLGISSDLWSNLKNDRLREFNAKLLPDLKVPYSDGTSYIVDRSLQNSLRKIDYEYFYTLKAHLKNPGKLVDRINNRKKLPVPQKKNIFSFEEVSFNARDFSKYFMGDFQDTILDSTYSYWLKRAAATVGYTLQFLEK